MSWSAAGLDAIAGAVGFFWLATASSTLAVVPLVGAFLDGDANRGRVRVVAQCARAAALSTLAVSWAIGGHAHPGFATLLVAGAIFGPANSLANISLDAMFLGGIAQAERGAMSRKAAFVRQLAMGTGLVVAGYALVRIDPGIVAISAAPLCVASLVLGAGLSCGTPAPRKVTGAFWPRLSRGGRVLLRHSMLRVAALMVVGAFSISYMSNALLAPIVFAQGKSAADFGLLETGWTAGAILAAWGLAMQPSRSLQTRAGLLQLIGLGGLCILFAVSASTFVQFAIFGLMGAGFASVRILGQAMVAETADAAELGPVQSSLSSLVSAASIAIYLVPALMQRWGPAETYALWGALVMALGGLALLLRPARAAPAAAPKARRDPSARRA